MKTYQEYKNLKANQENLIGALSAKLNGFEKRPGGLVALTDEFRALKNTYDNEFKKLQNLNLSGLKLFKKEINAERQAKRLERQKKCSI